MNSACRSSRMVARAGKPAGGWLKRTAHRPCSCSAFRAWAGGHAAFVVFWALTPEKWVQAAMNKSVSRSIFDVMTG
ncbi:hypothetical protein LP415_25475 [Polaromonas sp. P1(28)-8]|nr:hypothetical protein LP415_25475 [Polaromonas sp. P1(28)-8]